ncbi:unnamed protein product [Taenia asiatica]|uniref:Secreted protein n=1 Tax=Taenia asiatica TaxID=60517 RepID=A0A0R3VZG2_TAEAS|nr:unnamed protein product [Taenia asiatica]
MATTTTASSSGSETTSETTAAAAAMAAFPAFVWMGVTHQRPESLAPAASIVMTGLQVSPLTWVLLPKRLNPTVLWRVNHGFAVLPSRGMHHK